MADRVLVTGAGGFIGSHLTEALVTEGYSVRAMVHYNALNNFGWLEEISKEIFESVEIFPGDIRDPFLVQKCVSGCESVYHLAALIPIPYSYLAPASYVETNVLGTLNILQASLDEGVSCLVHTSTSETYGTAQYVPIDEKHPLVGQSPYSASKIGADKLAESYFKSFGLPVRTIRPFNTFGPRQSARAIIPTVVTQALSNGKSISLGALSPVRDFTYVKDLVRAFIAIGKSENTVGAVINVGRGEGVSIGDIARMILELCNSSEQVVFDPQRERPKESEVHKLICDNRKARTTIGWRPKYSFKNGLENTIEWIASHMDRYKCSVYNV